MSAKGPTPTRPDQEAMAGQSWPNVVGCAVNHVDDLAPALVWVHSSMDRDPTEHAGRHGREERIVRLLGPRKGHLDRGRRGLPDAVVVGVQREVLRPAQGEREVGPDGAEAHDGVGTHLKPGPAATGGGFGEDLPEPWVRYRLGVVGGEVVGHGLFKWCCKGPVEHVFRCRIPGQDLIICGD